MQYHYSEGGAPLCDDFVSLVGQIGNANGGSGLWGWLRWWCHDEGWKKSNQTRPKMKKTADEVAESLMGADN